MNPMRQPGSLNLGDLARPLGVSTALGLALVFALAVIASPDRPPMRARSIHNAPAATGTVAASTTPDPRPVYAGVLQHPASLDVAPDGRVYISDPGPGLVQVMWPWGAFAEPIGLSGVEAARLEEPGRLAIGPGPEPGSHRLYVLDEGNKRVVVYTLDGALIAEWRKVNGGGIAVASDGRVFVADKTLSMIRVFAPDGVELLQFGEKGEENGQFSRFSDIGLSPDGRVLAVGDLKAKRLQLFDLPADPASDDVRVRRGGVYDLTAGKYTLGDVTCRATTVNALGGDEAWIGEGNGACIVSKGPTTFPIASSTLDGLVCKATVRLPRIRRPSGKFYALATYDPNEGACGSKQDRLPAAPVILRYMDLELRRVNTLWPVVGSALFARLTHDATVRDTTPDQNLGNDDELQVRAAADQKLRAYLKVEVEAIATVIGQRDSVRLHIFASNGSDDGGSLYSVSNEAPTTTPDTTPTPWHEDRVTWNNAPPIAGTPFATAGPLANDQWVAFDVATLVPGDGIYSFGIQNASDNRVDFNSREADANVPVLIARMKIARAPTPANVVSPSPTPSAPPTDAPPTDTGTPAPTPTETATVAPSPTIEPSPTFEPGAAAIFAPIHDTRAQSSSPDKNYGTSAQLRVRTGITTTVYYSYLKFNITDLPTGRAILTATLRLYAYDGGPEVSVHPISNRYADESAPWTETGLTWNNAPPLDALLLDSRAKIDDETTVAFDVTPAITGEGPVSFGLRTTSESSSYFFSKEAPEHGPELLLIFEPRTDPRTATATPGTPPPATPTAATPTSDPPGTPGKAYLPWSEKPRAARSPTPRGTPETSATPTPQRTPSRTAVPRITATGTTTFRRR
jgi:sugar lactone lactonase YvrE